MPTLNGHSFLETKQPFLSVSFAILELGEPCAFSSKPFKLQMRKLRARRQGADASRRIQSLVSDRAAAAALSPSPGLQQDSRNGVLVY